MAGESAFGAKLKDYKPLHVISLLASITDALDYTGTARPRGIPFHSETRSLNRQAIYVMGDEIILRSLKEENLKERIFDI
jgi:hypothetical protein